MDPVIPPAMAAALAPLLSPNSVAQQLLTGPALPHETPPVPRTDGDPMLAIISRSL